MAVLRLKTQTFSSILTGVVAILLTTGMAHAGTVLEVGTALLDAQVICMAVNVGTTLVRVNSIKIIDGPGAEVTASTNCNFPGSIFPRLACVSYSVVPILIEGDTRCVIDVATASGAKNIRATLFVAGDPFDGGAFLLQAR